MDEDLLKVATLLNEKLQKSTEISIQNTHLDILVNLSHATKLQETLNRQNKGKFDLESLNSEFDPSRRKIGSVVGSQVAHYSSFILSFVHQSPKELVNYINSNKGTPLYMHIIQYVVPSFYGFFSSVEHSYYAMIFYSYVLRECEYEFALDVLSPFFCSILSYDYLSAIAYDIFWKCWIEEKTEAERFDTLVSIICGKIQLLSSPILAILRIATSMGWNDDMLFDLFVIRFLAVCLPRRMENFPELTDFDELNRLLMEIRSVFPYITGLLTSARNIREVPQIIDNSYRLFMSFLLRKEDISHFSAYLSSINALPDPRATAGFARSKMKAFFCETYPKIKMPPAADYTPILIPHLERLMTRLSIKKHVEELYAMSQCHMNTLTVSVANEMGEPLEEKCSKRYCILKSLTDYPEEFDERWIKIVSLLPTPPVYTKSIRLASLLLSRFNSMPPQSRYVSLIWAVKILSPRNELDYLPVLEPKAKILSTFVLLSGKAIGRASVRQYFDQDELKTWSKLDQVITKAMSKDAALCNDVGNTLNNFV